MPFEIASFYHFFPFDQYISTRSSIRHQLQEMGAKGTILLAPEGVNGTLSAEEGLKEFIDWLVSFTHMPERNIKWNNSLEMPFKKLKIRLKKEIITMGKPADAARRTGTHLSVEEWNMLLADPETIVLDTRNGYEVAEGSFKGAINPEIDTFSELPDYIERQLGDQKNKKIATFCTGGIRCEKLTSWMLDAGFEHVYQLDGGIIRYLQEEKHENLWQGKCFVFDERGAVG